MPTRCAQIEAVVVGDKVDRQAQMPKAAGPPDLDVATVMSAGETHENMTVDQQVLGATTTPRFVRTLWRYVSEFLGKSKLMTTLTA